MIELLDPKKNWSRIASNNGGPFWRTIAPLPKLRAGSAINPLVSQNLVYPNSAFTGKTFSQRKK